ncbi:MAG: hypothetical protein ACW97A_02330 [Candidatus Thorarchaeota archaeon]
MNKTSKEKAVSIRVRLERDILERIDLLAGENGRQRFIEDAILWRLDEELPPLVLELVKDMSEIRSRVEHLEQYQSTSVFLGSLSDLVKTKVCRDGIDRDLLGYFLQQSGATTPELAESILGSSSKRRTILDRIARLNQRAEDVLGSKILKYEKGVINGKRGAWWLIDPNLLLS